jgi:Signal peptidase, peptidase S26
VPLRQSRTEGLFVKRVIGLPGDHVACCDARGRITVNGKPLDETYVYPGNRPSVSRFSVTLGRGQIWVMGDHRNISVDSRKWGPVPVSGVAGRVVFAGPGWSDFAALRTPATFVADGLAPADTRPDLYLRLAVLALASVALLLLLAIFGITSAAVRKRRSRQAAARAAAARPLVEPMYGVYRIPPPRAPEDG